jgi:uncharacterized protein (TIGR03382 family)
MMAASSAAQTVLPLTIRFSGDDTSDSLLFSGAQCGDVLTLRWTYAGAVGSLCTGLKLWSTQAECGEAPGTDDVRYDEVANAVVQQTRQGTFNVAISELPGFRSGSTTPCGMDDLLKTHKVCGVIEYATVQCGLSTQQKMSASALKLIHDTKKPAAPVVNEIVANDKSLRVNFTVDKDSSVVFAQVRPQGETDYRAAGEATASTGFIIISGLANKTTYDVQVQARDAAGNLSEWSAPVAATPIETVGFWGAFRTAGGTDPAGCSTGVGSVLPLFGFLGFMLFRRRFQ